MKKPTPLELAREFVGLVDGLNLVPGMMASHDMDKEAISRELLRLHTENQEFADVISQTHVNYCDEAWTSRGMHAPECLLYHLGAS